MQKTGQVGADPGSPEGKGGILEFFLNLASYNFQDFFKFTSLKSSIL